MIAGAAHGTPKTFPFASPWCTIPPVGPPAGGASVIITVDSDKPLDRVCEALPQACADHRFGVMAVHDLKAKMKEKGVEFASECRVFEVCNPQAAKRVLEAEPMIGAALPCRIAVFPAGNGKTRLATIRPTALTALFSAKGLQPVAAEIEQTLEAIMNDAAH